MQAQNYGIMTIPMYQNRNRKREIARRTFVYATMVTTLVVALCVLLFVMLGYRFDPTTRQIDQAGLVHYNSFPRGAMVAVDGTNLNTTPVKNMIMPGQHQITMKLKGYESWQKAITIRSDTVTQLDYARLVPTEKTIAMVRDMTGLETAKFSKDGRYIVSIGHTADSQLVASWGDLRDIDAPRFTEQLLDTTLLAGYDDALHPDRQPTAHRFTIHSWDKNGRFVVVKHNYTIDGQAEQIQWVLLDREKPKELVDISSVVGFVMQDVELIGTNGDSLYVLQDTGDIRRVNLGDSTISRPLLSGVEEFSLYGSDTISFVAHDASTRLAGLWREDWKQYQTIRTLTAAEQEKPIHISVSEYFGKDTVAVSVGDTTTIYRGTLPGSETALEAFLQTGKKMSLGRSVTSLSISDNGRFVVMRDKTGFISYDLERASLSAEIALRGGDTDLKWLDNFHVWHVDETGQLLIQEFDGANSHKLLPALSSYDATLSSDGKYIYSFSEKDGALQLQRLSMIAK